MGQTRMLLGNVKGKPGYIKNVTVTSDSTHLDTPYATVDMGGEPGAQTIDISFFGLQGPQGDKGDAGGVDPGGTSSQLVLGDGSLVDIQTFLTDNIEIIREALGIATTEKDGLLPKLPKDPEG